MVAPKDKNPQDQPSLPIAPASNPPKLGPALPETYVSPQQAELQKMAVTSAAPSAKNVQQASTISSALRDAGFQPSVSPTQKVGGYVQPSVSDALATATANTNTQSMQEGAWVKRNGKWKLIPKQQFQGGFNPGSVTDSNTGGFGTSAMLASPFKKTWETIGPRSAVGQYTGGRFAGDIASVVKTPFSFFKKYAGSPVAKVSSKAVDSIPYTEWAENVVGKTLSVAGGAGADIWNLAVRDTVRGTMTTTMTGIQLIENLVFFGAAAINYSMDDTEAYNKDVSIWDQARGVFTNTTLAQDLMGGDTGQGYLPGGPAEEERNKLEEKLRPKIFGQTGTVGRTFAALGVMANLYESGDDVHSLISGTLDAAFQVYFDPMNGIQIPKVLRTFADVPTAAVSTSDMRKLIKAGIAINKETLSKVDEVISQVDEASQLTDEAVNLLTPQPGTFWSGDRFGATRGQPLEKWNNLGPNGPTNPDNVLGSAGYVSNLSPLGTSYTVAEQGFERIDEMLSLPGGVEVKVPIVPPESLVYEFRVPETDFNIIDAETYWPVDPSVPWNLRSAAKDLGFDSETIEGFRQKLSDIGINVDVVPGANPLDEIFNSMDGFFANAKDDFVPGEGDSFDDFLASLETPEQIKLIKVRNILADPQTWLKKSLEGAASGSSRFFSNQRMEMLLQRIDDALSDEQYLRPGRGYEYPVSPAGQGAALDAALVSGNASDITTVSQSSKGRALTLVIDDPHTGGAAYFGPPVQMLQEFVSETDNWLLSWPEGSAENTFLTGIRAEGAKLAEDFLSTARKIDQKTPAPTTGTNPLNKELFEQGISELKDLSVRYENFYFDSIEKLQNSEFDPLILDQYRTSRLLFINNQGIENPIWYYQFKLNERVGVEITETGFRTKSLDTNIELGDVGPFKGATVSSNARSGSFDISFAKHEVLGIDNPSGIDNVNHWMQSKGVDAVRYDGGKRVGGYGSHEAMAVFAGEKLNLVAQRTGEQLPVALAKSKLLQGEELAVSADAIAKARGYLDAHGLIEAGRKTVGLGTYDAWKLSGTAKNMFKAVANNDNAYEIWATWLKGRSPVLAQRLADATTPEAVEAIMDGAVKNLDPKEHLRQLPGWSGNVVGEIGYRTKQAISKNSSFAATLPRSYSLPIDDLAAGTNHLHDTMIVLETPLEVRTELMNEYIRIISQDEPTKIRGDLFDFAKNFKDATIKDKIKPIVEKLKAPLLKTIEEMTPFERLTMNRRTQMVERIEELVKKTSTFLVNREEEVVRYTWDDVGRSVPLEWMDGNGLGPMYLVQQRTNEIALLPWDDKELTQLLKATSDWAEYSMLARSLPGMGQTMDALDYAIEGAFWLQSKWKRAVLFSGRYPLRVVPEEISRNVLSGQFGNEFGFVAELLTGRLNKDIYGRILPRITEADDLALKLDEALNVLPSRISRARARGNTRLADSLQKRLDKIDVTSTQARLDEVELMLESDVASARDVMIGPYPTKAGETALGPTVTKHMRKSSQQSVYRNENPELWLKGVSQAVMDRAADPLGASVARAMSTGATGALDKIAMEMFDGSLRIPYQSYYEGAGKLKPSYEWDSLAGAKRYVDQAVRDLTDITGGHEHLLSAIANNRVLIGGKAYSLGRRTAYGNIPSAEFTQLLKMGDPDDITIPVFASWSKAPDGTNVFPRASQFDEKRSKNVFSWWMQNAYGRSSDKFARIPMWNARKWNLIADMVPLLTKEEALKLKDSLPSLNLPAHVVENILDNIPRADGIGTLDILENTAGYYATQDTINLLFDSSKRTLFGRNHRLLFPFFDAFREVGAQMVKTAINPLATHKIDKAAEALGNLRIGGPGQTNIIGPGDIDGDSKDEGFVYRDPQTNSLSFNFPLIGGVARALTGIPFDFKVSVGSLSMATSVIPSVGPYVALTYSAIPYRQGETWDKLNKLIIPYGEPSGDLQDYFTPLAIQRFAQGVAAGTPLERVANFMGNPNTDPVYKTLQNRTFMAELASGKYSQDEAGVREAMQVSQDKGNTLWWLRGLTQFFSPGAPISQFYAKQGEQLVPLGTLLDSMRKTENDIRDKGGTFQDQMDAVVNQYGEFVIPFLASISETTVPGAESSKDFYKFKLENEDLFKRYPEVAGYFGPNTNEFDQEIYNIQKRAGELVALPKEEIATQVEQLWGNFRYNKADREFTQALGETPIKAYALSIAESQIKASLPSWNRALSYQEYNNKIVNSVNSIIKASNDPKLADLPSIPTLKEYLVSRNEIINVITRASDLRSVSSWRDNRGGIIEREALKIIGDRLAESNPDFKPLWDSVLSREFKTLTEQEKILAKTGQLP